jgi:hypothetical protein
MCIQKTGTNDNRYHVYRKQEQITIDIMYTGATGTNDNRYHVYKRQQEPLIGRHRLYRSRR